MIERIGRYRIVDEIGRGGMAVVYRGYDPHIHRMLAIKTPHAEHLADPDQRKRFLAEARAAGTLAHPGIVTIFDVGEQDGVPFIAMELLDGIALDAYLRAHPPKSIRTLLRIAIQIAEALDFAHRHGVVHRDIKPENILCRGETPAVKVADFGIAQFGTGRLGDEAIAGSPHYVAPERLRGEPAEPRSDLYSLGVLLFWMLSGNTPFAAASVPELLSQVLREPAPAPASRFPDPPRALLELIAALLQKQPRDRPGTAADLIDELQRIDDRLAERERNWAGQRIVPIRIRWPVVMAGLVAATIAVGLVLASRTQERAIGELAFDYGFTLAQQLALQSAEDLLLDDRIAIQTLAEAMAENREIDEIIIHDRRGRVIARSGAQQADPADPTHPDDRLPGPDATLVHQRGDIRAYRASDADGRDLLRFDTPVVYSGRVVGRLKLGLSTAPLATANRTLILAMLGVAGATLAAVMVGVYVLTRRLMAPVETLRRALWRIAQGRLDSRIQARRRDEFEHVFTAFNAMADSVQARLSEPSGEPAAGERSGNADGGSDPTLSPREPDRPPAGFPGDA